MSDASPRPTASRNVRHWIDWSILAAVVLFFVAYPCPEELAPRAWTLLCIFTTTIVAFLLSPLPMPVVGLIAMTACTMTGTLTMKQALSSFSDPTIWLVVGAFFLSRAFIVTGLGNRIAYIFMRLLGHSTLGLGYAFALTALVLGPAIPSGAARLGGILFPLHLSTALAYGSDPEKGTERLIGSYLMFNILQCNLVVGAMFVTAIATNPMILLLAEPFGIHLTWGKWALGACVPGLLALGLIPFLLYIIWPPGIKHSPTAVQIATERLREMGPVSKEQKILFIVFILLITFWIIGDKLHIGATATALGGVCVLLVTRVLTWDQLAGEKSAWGTMIWFSALIMMARYLNEFGLITWLIEGLAEPLRGMSPWAVFYSVIGFYVYSHYMFASQLAHAAAMYSGCLGILIGLNVPPMLAALGLSYCSNLMGGLTYYGNGAGPIFLNSGYIPVKEWMILGFLCSLVLLACFVGIGPLWWKCIGMI